MGSRKRKLDKNKQTETITSPMNDYGFNSTTYDDEDRLTAWSRPDNYSQSWTLSEVGEWELFADNAPAVTRLYNDVHELTTNNGTSVVHDAKGNLTTNSNAQTYTWDFDNRMASATVGADTHTYKYDALGRRVSKTVDSATTVFIYDGQQVVAEYDSLNGPNDAALRQYVYASYIDEPVAMIDPESILYYHQNGLYSVVALTTSVGTPDQRYSYTAYGVPTISSETLINPYLYTGRRYDQETGLYYYRARYYDASLGRFIGRDPIGYVGSRWNLYEYVDSCPLRNLDPLGLMAENGNKKKEKKKSCGDLMKEFKAGTLGGAKIQNDPAIKLALGCSVNFFCADSCGKGGDGEPLGGQAWGSKDDGYYHVCISNSFIANAKDPERAIIAVLLHESVHARGPLRNKCFCNPGQPYDGKPPIPGDLKPPADATDEELTELCNICVRSETAAYKKSCDYLIPKAVSRTANKYCVDKGIYDSCNHVCTSLKEPSPPEKWPPDNWPWPKPPKKK